MRKTFIKRLDFLQQCGINAIVFQVRPEADAFYASKLEPWSRFLTGTQGQAPAGRFDPMAFLIEECHKRNMEFHAWLNPYRARMGSETDLASNHIYFKPPEWFVTYNKQLLFDPGLPALPVLEPGKLVMEVKFTELLPQLVRELIPPGAAEMTAVSKYLLCREKTAWRTGPGGWADAVPRWDGPVKQRKGGAL